MDLGKRGGKEWRSVQIKGRAEIIVAKDKRFEAALDKYNLARITKERACRRFDLIKITPLQIFYFDTNLSKEKYAVYQLWKREETDKKATSKVSKPS